jgi:hypothetical protein
MQDEIYQWWHSVKRHWESTWIASKHLLQNTTCADFGIWKGILNSKARKEFNCDTVIGIEPDPIHLRDCAKFNPGTVLYKSIDQIKEHTKVDVLFMHGVICLLGDEWTSDCKKLCEKIDADIIHIRHKDFERNTPVSGVGNPTYVGRETNPLNLENYNKSPSSKAVIDFFTKLNYKLEKQSGELLILRKQ